ncbi:MAG: hypothetical protein AB1797_06630 [bacterium]
MPDQAIASSNLKAPQVAPQIDSKQAFLTANQFVLSYLRDMFSAGFPTRVVFPTQSIWAVPVVLTYPKLGIVGEVGVVAVDAELGNVVGWTPFEEMERTAKELYEGKKREIEAVFS